jgi:hypothetical protein
MLGDAAAMCCLQSTSSSCMSHMCPLQHMLLHTGQSCTAAGCHVHRSTTCISSPQNKHTLLHGGLIWPAAASWPPHGASMISDAKIPPPWQAVRSWFLWPSCPCKLAYACRLCIAWHTTPHTATSCTLCHIISRVHWRHACCSTPFSRSPTRSPTAMLQLPKPSSCPTSSPSCLSQYCSFDICLPLVSPPPQPLCPHS